MKWWGWGVDGVAFNPDNKPKFPGFVQEKVGIDIYHTTSEPRFEDLDVPASQLPEDLRATLVAALSEEQVVTEDLERVVHAYGKGVRDLVRVRRGELGRVPDAILYPRDEDQVVAIVEAAVAADAVLIPFGGGSNIVGALEAEPGEQRTVLSIDMGLLNKVLEIDENSGLARIQAGALGPDLEEQLGRRGWTLGHFPDSFNHSTLGGWIATRSSGMQSDKYGDIADITRGLRMVTPAGEVVALRPLPATSSGPSVREMILGSEGRLGIITEATVAIHRVPEVREIQAYFFPSYAQGLACMQAIAFSDAAPSVARVSDHRETAFTLATSKESKGVSNLVTKALMTYLKQRRWDLSKLCLSFIGFEGSAQHVRYEKAQVNRIVSEHGGIGVGKGPGVLYDQKKFDTPYIRDFLLDRGAVADVSETATPWSSTQQVYDAVIAAAENAMAEQGVAGYIMAHLSHSYHSGACQYFTFAIADDSDEAIDKYDAVKRAVQQAFVDNNGTVSHHHGVGEEHSPWMEQDISPAGVGIQRSLFGAVDPGRNFNPGKIIHDGQPGISSNSKQPAATDEG
ncbi:FAD-binding oxidoreductase [Parenemella sanctibonifatiensis]|uniref:FAD-binding oxidoreductase n=2 Tax=Parenemella sanctibonifatiensis TaxID=2016505 RepID=A0A255E9B7_9ACTN|nr:FAD-binding oxidoreductase [Parenemella sanctibonifatiensis]OYN90383.1 FAD-binding oxidoreductase [Parenemella sanctibonifatiensis]